MRAARVIIAISIAFVGLMFVLQRAAAEAGHRPETSPEFSEGLAEGPHRVYLAMVTARSGEANRASTSMPNATIGVGARAGLSCDDGETVPVGGARITVVTDEGPRIAMTDETGYALFTATMQPAVVQIEWPVGFLPCPNSPPIVELPSGTGEVEFMAVAGH